VLPGARTLAISPAEWILNIGMLAPLAGMRSVDTVYWSLLVEIQFYAVAALGVRAVGYGRLPAALLTWLLLGTGLQVASAAITHGWRVPFPGQEYIGYFCVGAALSFAQHRSSRDPWVWALLVFGFIASCGQAVVYARVLGAHFHATFDPRVVVSVVAVSTGLVATTRAFALGPRAATFATLVGGATYPLYLLHQYVSYALMNSFFGSSERWVAFAVDVAAMLARAIVVYSCFDRPIRRQLTSVLLPRGAAATERAPIL